MHRNTVNGDCPGKTDLHADVLRAARIFVEYWPQTRIEGDIPVEAVRATAQERVRDSCSACRADLHRSMGH